MPICFAAPAVGLCILDLVIKRFVERRIDLKEERKLWKGRIRIRKVYNKGAAFNLLESHPLAVRRISVVLAVGLLCYDVILLRKQGHWMEKTGAALFTGGALSNVAERVLKGHVTDYFGFQVKWPYLAKTTFNLGDLMIFVGAVLAGFEQK